MSLLTFLRYKSKIAIILIVILVIFILVHNFRNKFHKDPNGEQLGDSYQLPALSHIQPSKPRLSVLVPFRDRFDELLAFVPHLTGFLRAQDIGPFSIHILNQSGRFRFNRGALTNVGFLLTKNHSDYIAIHDVDLLPLNKNLSYSYPKDGPYHLSSPEYHPRYSYEKYFGGIVLINNAQFELLNGMSNRYFGWGMEDDEFYTRIKAAKLPIFKPRKLTTDRNNTFLHLHYNRKRDSFKTKEQREALKRRDRITGLRDIKYSIIAEHDLMIDRIYQCTIYNIELQCDINQTPWCLHDQSSKLPSTPYQIRIEN